MAKRNDDLLATHIHTGNFPAIGRLVASGRALTENEVEAITAALTKVAFGQFTITPSWWLLVNSLLQRSHSLREHVLRYLAAKRRQAQPTPIGLLTGPIYFTPLPD